MTLSSDMKVQAWTNRASLNDSPALGSSLPVIRFIAPYILHLSVLYIF